MGLLYQIIYKLNIASDLNLLLAQDSPQSTSIVLALMRV